MNKDSFTLIELLVVIAIVGILAGIIVVSMTNATDSARITKAKVFSTSLRDSQSLGLIFEMTFDELPTAINGTTIRDSWGTSSGVLNTGDGASEKLKTESSCVFGKCIEFDGVNDYVNCGSNLPIGLNSFTFSVWAKTSRSQVQSVINRQSSITGWRGTLYVPYSTDRNSLFYVTDGGYSNSSIYCYAVPYNTPSFADNKWHYYVGVCDRGAHNPPDLYVDGAIQNNMGNGYCDQLIDDIPLGQLTIGGITSSYFQGLIDDVRIFNIAVKSSQVKSEYIAGLKQLLATGQLTNQEYWQRIASIESREAEN